MHFRLSSLFWMLVVVIASSALYGVKYKVQALKDQLADTHRQIAKQQEALHVIRAEWAYLTRPQRLSELAEKHTALISLQGQQMTTLAGIPYAPLPEMEDNAIIPAALAVPPQGEPESALRERGNAE